MKNIATSYDRSLRTPEEEVNKSSRLSGLVSVGQVVIVLAGQLTLSLRNAALWRRTESY